MATISKITGPAEVQIKSTSLSGDQVSRTDAGQRHKPPTTGTGRPKGVQEVLKQQHDKELQSQAVPEKDLRELVASLQETIDRASKEHYAVGFREDHGTGTQIIEIKDKEGHLVKQFPPEKVLNLQRKLDELSGMVIDEMI